jgi:hypothetical protein
MARGVCAISRQALNMLIIDLLANAELARAVHCSRWAPEGVRQESACIGRQIE